MLQKKPKHLCFRLAGPAEPQLTSPSHAPETFPSKEPQQTPNCFCCFQSHQNILPSLQMSTIPACATATGEKEEGRGGLERFFFQTPHFNYAEWNLEATLFSRLHFSISAADATCRFPPGELEPGYIIPWIPLEPRGSDLIGWPPTSRCQIPESRPGTPESNIRGTAPRNMTSGVTHGYNVLSLEDRIGAAGQA